MRETQLAMLHETQHNIAKVSLYFYTLPHYIKNTNKQGAFFMYEYEKGIVATLAGLAVLLAWQLLKTVFYRLPKALACLGIRHN